MNALIDSLDSLLSFMAEEGQAMLKHKFPPSVLEAMENLQTEIAIHYPTDEKV